MSIDQAASRVAQMNRRLELGIDNAFPPVLLAQFARSLAASAGDLAKALDGVPSSYVGPIEVDATLPPASAALLVAMLGGEPAPDTVPECWTG